MAKDRTNRDDIYYSPAIILDLYKNTEIEVGQQKLKNSRKYKVLREARVASIFSLALSAYEGGVWWLKANHKDEAPDFFAFNTKPIEDSNFIEGVNANLEIFEWNKYSDETLVNAILNKVHNWTTPKITVICEVTKKELSNRTIEKLHNKLRLEKINVLDFWLVARHSKYKDSFVVRVLPEIIYLKIPKVIPDYFYKPFQFVSKRRGKGFTDGGLMSINSEMELIEVKD